MQERLKVYEEKMNKSYDALLNEYTSIRAGRANPHVLDKIKVDYYGAPTPLQQVANISVPEPRMILIQPWEKKLIKDIEKAILTSDLGKDVKKKGEGAKVAVRNIRRDANDLLKKLEKGGEITEDELADGEDQIQKLTDKMIAKVDKAVEEKTAEIMTV